MIIPNFFSRIATIAISQIAGKNILALGGKAVGKTTLQAFLRDGSIANEYIATDMETLNPGVFRNNVNKTNYYFKTGKDISGSEDFREIWKQPFLESDVCLYVFNTYEVFKKKRVTLPLMRNHLNLLNKWKELNYRKTPIILVGTFSDRIPQNRFSEESIKSTIEPAIRIGKVETHHVFIGSLKDRESAQLLMEKTFKILDLNGVI